MNRAARLTFASIIAPGIFPGLAQFFYPRTWFPLSFALNAFIIIGAIGYCFSLPGMLFIARGCRSRLRWLFIPIAAALFAYPIHWLFAEWFGALVDGSEMTQRFNLLYVAMLMYIASGFIFVLFVPSDNAQMSQGHA